MIEMLLDPIVWLWIAMVAMWIDLQLIGIRIKRMGG